MKVFVTGATGQLGYDCVKELLTRGHSVLAGGREAGGAFEPDASFVRLDITDREAVRRFLREARPDAILHCAAWTAVDAAEEPENRGVVDKINRLGTQYLAETAAELGAKLLYISTDYVFDGRGERPWEPDDRCFAPLNVYGRSKLEGEQAVCAALERFFIVRTAWVFGLKGKNFIRTMLSVGRTHERVRVVDDQIGTPTYTKDLARLLADILESEKYGFYHATNEGGYISWFDLCCECYRQAGLLTTVVPVSTEEYGLSKAVRPKNSRLSKRKLAEAGFAPLPDWHDAVRRYLAEAGF